MPVVPFAATRSGIRDFLLAVSALLSVSLLLYLHHLDLPPTSAFSAVQSTAALPPPLSLHHILFSIASSSASIHRRAPYLRLWHRPISRLNNTFLFLDRPLPSPTPPSLPPIIIPPNASSLDAGHRIARIVKDAIALNVPGVYCSESYEQNEKFSFDMAFGGGGFVISAPLARVLARVLDSCLDRYRHLYGSDARIFACLAELGVPLTVETGFHQVDVRGDLFGFLSAHPLSLVASLHHIDAIEPIFPGMSRISALEHLSKPLRVDPSRIFQQTVCYYHTNSVTVSISWGYAVQVYEENHLLPEVLSLQRTFRPWKRGKNVASSRYMFNTRDYPIDPCKRPVVFFLHTVTADTTGIWTEYTRHAGNCSKIKALERLKVVKVYSRNLDFDLEQVARSTKGEKKAKMQIAKVLSKPQSSNRLVFLLISSCLLCLAYLLTSFLILPNTKVVHFSSSLQGLSSPTTLEHVVFGIASNKKSWLSRKEYVRIWWRPKEMRGCVFLESMPPNGTLDRVDADSLPPICVSEDTSRFRYTFRNGLRSAIRVARVVSETVALNHPNVRWFVFGDDDTVFLPENLVRTLSKYDHGLWYYIGTKSESFAQNKLFSYEMAFGGAGFAISYPLAKVLASVFDSCLARYPHLYGSDARIHACLAELGVSLTHEPGFHQMDIRGSMFGFLTSHPLKPLVSLHHWDAMDPIFPKMTPKEAVQHLFRAVNIDSQRVVQQTVCYDRWFSWTISVSWGYAVQIFPHHLSLPEALRTLQTYLPWKKGGGGVYDLYEVDSLGYQPDPCNRPTVFFLHTVSSGRDGIRSIYRQKTSKNCTFVASSPRKLEEIRVLSNKQDLDHGQLVAPRRQCCDVLPSVAGNVMEIAIREFATRISSQLATDHGRGPTQPTDGFASYLVTLHCDPDPGNLSLVTINLYCLSLERRLELTAGDGTSGRTFRRVLIPNSGIRATGILTGGTLRRPSAPSDRLGFENIVKMKFVLIKEKVFKAVDLKYNEKETDQKKSEMNEYALSSIMLNLSDSVLRKVCTIKSAKELWDKLDELYNLTSLSSRMFLLEKIFNYKLDLNNDMDANLDIFNKLVQDIKMFGDKHIDDYTAIALLNTIPEANNDVKSAIKYGRDNITFDTVVNGLKSKEMELKHGRGAKTPAYNVMHVREKNYSSSNHNNRKCYRCGEPGHYAKYCKKPKDKNQNNDAHSNVVSTLSCLLTLSESGSVVVLLEK
ncbi:ERV-F provirus ancestral Env polyprotein [Perilla frutescens var. hirtella]|nr:ERV-F provirus ancestral Env polyprotein [Perilla frutescens var. hirtella]